MVKYKTGSLNTIFSALADPTRRKILARLAKKASAVSDLAEPFSISLPAISKHLRVLAGAGLIIQEKEGQVRRCYLLAEPLKDAADWIAHYRKFWKDQFDGLENYLEKVHKK